MGALAFLMSEISNVQDRDRDVGDEESLDNRIPDAVEERHEDSEKVVLRQIDPKISAKYVVALLFFDGIEHRVSWRGSAQPDRQVGY